MQAEAPLIFHNTKLMLLRNRGWSDIRGVQKRGLHMAKT